MNVQTKRVIKAAVIGLILSITITAVNITANGLKPWELDEFQILNPEVLAHWIGGVGFLPALFVLIAVATSFRKVGVRVSALNALGGILVLSLVIAIGVVTAAYVKFALRSDTELFYGSGATRNYYVAKIFESCFHSQRLRPENRAASDALLKTYCECFANTVADTTTYAEGKYLTEHGNPSAEEKARIQSYGEKCMVSATR
jgi:hypothetical protein